LDECGGTEQYEIDGFLYHYHMVGPVGDLVSEPTDPLPDSDMQPYTVGCYKGVVFDWSVLEESDNGASCARDGYNSSTYTATATAGVTDVYSLRGNNSASTSTCNTASGNDSTYTEAIESAVGANNGYVRHIEASGCPNYPTSPVGDNPDYASEQDKDYEIQAYPCFSDSDDYDVTCIDGPVGITLNGISVLSYYPGTCGDDAVVEEGDTFDQCSGHAAESGDYHYHITPSCLLDQMGDYDNVAEHSPLIGWAFDGFPIYGPYGPGGDLIYPCSHSSADESACLDECGGTEQYEIDGFLYHYHMVGPVGDLVSEPTDPVPGTDMKPYTVGCLKGVVFDWSFWEGTDNGASCLRDGYNSTYTATAADGVTDVYSSRSLQTVEPTEQSAEPTEPFTDPEDLDASYWENRALENSEKARIWMIIGIVFIGLCVLLIALIVYLVWKHHCGKKTGSQSAEDTELGRTTQNQHVTQTSS